MTVTSTNQKVTFNGNGSTTVFAYNFKIFADADLLVVLRVTATGAETTQTLTTNYTVSGAGETSGGNVTMGTAPASGTTLTVLRAQPNLQGLDLVPNDPFPAGNLEDSLDKLTFMVQANEEEISRAVRFTSANTITSPEFATTVAERANKLFSFDASGNLQITQEIGVARGNWAASTAYDNRDIINDTSNQDVYIVNTAHTSSGSLPISTNANASKYTLLIDASQINKVVSDTSPQLGGELQSNSHDIKMADGDKVIFGTNSDATIEYDEAATDKLKIVASSVSLSGNISALSFDPTNDVSSGDNASLGYTSAEGAILIGQGTTNDITLKNDTDTAVLEIPTGTTNVTIAGNLATGGTITATTSISIGSAVLAESELEMLDGITAGTVAGSKAVVVDGNKDASSFRNLTASGAITGGSLVIGSADISEAELEMIDGITAGTAAASKAMVLDGSADITGGRNLTISGELDAATLDISGDIDVAGDSVLASVDVTGVATAATFEPDGDTAAADNAAIGYTAAEGLILTGQGSTGDVTIKNDADAVVLQVPTGTTNVNIIGNLDVDGTLTMGSTATLNSSGVLQTAAQTNITSVGTLTALAVDNITLDGNTISTTDSNGNLLLTPNGTGDIIAETDKFYIRNTNDGQLGPYLILDHVTTSPGSVDFNGIILVNTTDAGGNVFQPFTLAVVSTDVTSGAATGKALFTVKEDGATPYYLTLDGDAEKVILGKSTDITGSLDVSANAVIDGNVGIGATPTTWSLGKALNIGAPENYIWGESGNNLHIGNNAYYNSGYKYVSTDEASSYTQYGGTHAWYTAASGSADAALTWIQTLYIDASGNIIIPNSGGTLQTATAGSQNVRIGENAGDAIAAGGNYNIFVGYNAGTSNTIGDENVAIGHAALLANVAGSKSTAIGQGALNAQNKASDAAGDQHNTAVGYHAGVAVSEAVDNTLIGSIAGDSLNTGGNNTAVGKQALSADTKGGTAVAIGQLALGAQNFTDAMDNYNVAIGYSAGVGIAAAGGHIAGRFNTLIGGLAGDNITTGDSNIIIGKGIDAASATADGQLNIGGMIFGTGGAGGNVGIGIDAPAQKFDIQSAATAACRVLATNSNTRATYLAQAHTSGGADVNMVLGVFGDASQGELSMSTNHKLVLYTNNDPDKGVTVETSGDVTIENGNLVVGTDGKGIDFSAQTASSATNASTTSELLDHYEEGTWTAVPSSGTLGTTVARYTRIGRTVYVELNTTLSGTRGSESFRISGLPFDSTTWTAASMYCAVFDDEGTHQLSSAFQGGAAAIAFVNWGAEAIGTDFGNGYFVVSGTYDI